MAYVEQLATVLGREVWQNAGSPEVDKDRLGVAIGTGLGGGDALIDAVDKLKNGGYRKVSPLAVQMVMPNGPSAVVGLELKARAGVITPVSACSSGSEAIANAWRMIVMGDADMVVTGGVEGYIDAVPIAAFTMMRAMSTRNDDPKGASRPFDKDRDGFVFGEAGALDGHRDRRARQGSRCHHPRSSAGRRYHLRRVPPGRSRSRGHGRRAGDDAGDRRPPV